MAVTKSFYKDYRSAKAAKPKKSIKEKYAGFTTYTKGQQVAFKIICKDMASTDPEAADIARKEGWI